jgi:stress-induced-phosphoprotein 1
MSEQLKKEATDLYYAKKFEEAIIKYEEAFQLDPKNMTHLSNIGACYYEMKNYEKSIESCLKAVEIGNEYRSEFKLKAKALRRVGDCYRKLENYEQAIFYYNKSLVEEHNKQTVDLLKTVQTEMEEKEKQSYIDPELSLKARQEGNEFFKKGDYPEAVKSYTEAIKRDPNDKVAYTNRATAYTKLGAIPQAIKDCDKALEIDGKFVKAFNKKAYALFLMKDYYKALETYQIALEIEPDNKEVENGIKTTLSKMNEGQDEDTVKRNIQNNPELMQILGDPMMQTVLKDLQENNKEAIMQHINNPDIRTKIDKLVKAGVIKTQ